MRRPLLCGCSCLFVMIAIWTQLTNPPPWDSDNTRWEGEYVRVLGQVYQKEYRISYGEEKLIIYLDSILYSEEEETSSLQIQSFSKKLSKVNSVNNIICEISMSEFPEGKELPALGSKVIMEGVWQGFRQATNEGEFDASNYYAIEGICAKLKNAQILAVDQNYWMIRENLHGIKQELLGNLYEAFEQKEASILAKMLLGDGSGLDPEVKDLYQSNGIVHILSISGLHISMLGMGLYIILRRFSLPIIPAAILGGILILLYGLMTGFGVSACRAIGMYLIHMLGEIWGKTYDMLTAMGVLGIIMLLDNPLLAYHSGFLLSFSSVCGVGILAPGLQVPMKWFREMAGENKGIRMRKKIMERAMSGFTTSLSVTLFTLPIQLFFFYKIPIYSVVINVFVIPFMSIVMVLGIVLMIFPELSFLSPVETWIFNWFEWLCMMFEKLPGHTLVAGKPAMIQIIMYYVCLFLFMYFRKKDKHYKALGMITVAVLILMLRFRGALEIYVLDVGQGDCICVITKRECFIFDGGSSSRANIGENVILPFLQYHGIKKVDGVFLSHADTDHINGIMELLEKDLIPIEKIWVPKSALQEFGKRLKPSYKTDMEYAVKGDVWKNTAYTLSCMHPGEDDEEERNAGSLCLLLETEAFTMLFTGDVEGMGERILTKELKSQNISQIDILKVAHHGSAYSSSWEFLQQTRPQLAIISCGRNNSYGHPHQDALKRLEEINSTIISTPDSGEIMIEVGRKIRITEYLK